MFTRKPHLSDQDLVMLVDAELEADREVWARRHIEECNSCASRLAALDRTTADLAAIYKRPSHDASSPAASRARLVAALDSDGGRRGQWRHRMPPGIAYLAASALLAVVGFGWLQLAGRPARDTLSPGVLPIASLTPGAAKDITAEELCRVAPSDPPPVPDAVRQEVLRRYGLAHLSPHEYELDYLITPALGGTNEPANLWPELYASEVWNAFVKDELEDLLPKLVCEGRVAPEVAQRDMANNWIAAYKKYFNTDRPRRNGSGLGARGSGSA